VWLLGWAPGQHTEIHDHGGALGAFAVADGELAEELFGSDWLPRAIRRHRAPRTTVLGPAVVHRVGAPGPHTAVSVHAYSPPDLPLRYAPRAVLAEGDGGAR
jgi:predicted metal-dependent enzyme (double-stranded beta helix superfamily)